MSVISLNQHSLIRMPSRLAFLRFVLGITALTGLLAWNDLAQATVDLFGAAPVTARWIGLCAVFAGGGLLALALFLGTFVPALRARFEQLRLPHAAAPGRRAVAGIGAVLSLLPLIAATLHPYFGEMVSGRTGLKLDILWWQSVLLAACLVTLRRADFNVPGALAAAVIVQAAFFRTLVYLPDISTYPLALGYSEGSRFYNASLFFGAALYGNATALPVLHPTLHFLLSLPFLIPNSPLWLHRAWQVLLRTGLVAVVAIVLARRMRIEGGITRWVFAAWAFLFLFQGPIYLHLTVPVIIVLAAFDPRAALSASPGRNVRSWTAVLVASAWVGLSRINWIPVPGMLAAALYLLELPASSTSGGLLRYLRRPVVWFLAGSATAYAASRLYIAWSGNAPSMFNSSLSSDLLWYRLLPSPVNSLGVLGGALLVSLPPAIIIILVLWRGGRLMHSVRLAGLVAALLVLFTGGLVVSAKIGGGADLHNLDAYLNLLLIVTSAFFWGRYAAEATPPDAPDGAIVFPWQALALAITVPVVFAAQQGSPIVLRDRAKAEEGISELRRIVDRVRPEGGEVLFISQRQLLTFGELPGVTLAEPYEKETLMEMVMARNQTYLDQFYADLRNHRYALIVVGQNRGDFRGPDHPWAEEDDLWRSKVGRMIGCTYDPEAIEGLDASIYFPRAHNGRCPQP